MNDEKTFLALIERERAARKLAEQLLEAKAEEFIQSEMQWLNLMAMMEMQLQHDLKIFKDFLTEGLCQDISAARFFLSSQDTPNPALNAIDLIQEHANKIVRLVEESPYLSKQPQCDERSKEAISNFVKSLPKNNREAFNGMIHRLMDVLPIWSRDTKRNAQFLHEGKSIQLWLAGGTTQPLGPRVFDALVRRPALQLGVDSSESSLENGILTIRFRL